MRIKLSILLLILAQNFLCAQNKYLNGISLLQQEKYEQAIAKLSEAINENNNVFKSHFYRGIGYYNTQEYKDAETDFKTANQAGIIKADLWLAKLYAKDKNPATSINYLKNYLNSVGYLEGEKAKSATEFSNIHFSNEWFDLVSQEKSSLDESIEEAYFYSTRNDPKSGIKRIDNVIQEQGDNIELYKIRGQLYLQDNNFPLALMDLKKAHDLAPTNIETIQLLGDIYFKLQEFRKASELYLQVYTKAPERFRIYLELAEAYQGEDDLEQARRFVREYLQYFNSDLKARYQLATIYFESGEYTNALKEINPLIAQDQSNAGWYLLRGKCYLETGTYKYAYQDLTMSLDLDPGNTETNRLIGNTLFLQGNNKKACYYWERASKRGDREAQKLIIEHCQNYN